MQIERLEYFIHVAEIKSINLTSETLHISQQALSQSMMNLEKELGVSLFERSNKGVVLTEKGKELYKVAIEIVGKWERMKQDFNSESNLDGSFKIGMVPYMETEYYSFFKPYIETKFPKLKISEITMDNKGLIESLKERKIDLALANMKETNEFLDSSIRLIILGQEKLDLLVGVSSPLASYSAVSFEDIRKYLIALQKVGYDESENVLLNVLRDNQCYNIINVNSIVTVQKMVAEGTAITFGNTGSLLLAGYEDRIVRISLRDTFKMTKCVLFEETHVREEFAIQKIIECLRAKFAR